MSAEIPKIVTLPDGKEIPVSVIKSDAELSPEAASLQKSAEKASKNAVETAFSKGLSVTVGRDGKILRLYPDGREEIVGEYPVQ